MSRQPAAARIIVVLIVLVLAFVGCATLTGHRSEHDDAALAAAVKSALATDENLSTAAKISVDTTHGNVYLTGIIGSELERLRAAEVARKVEGVFKVTNRLQVADEVPARRQVDR